MTFGTNAVATSTPVDPEAEYNEISKTIRDNKKQVLDKITTNIHNSKIILVSSPNLKLKLFFFTKTLPLMKTCKESCLAEGIQY